MLRLALGSCLLLLGASGARASGLEQPIAYQTEGFWAYGEPLQNAPPGTAGVVQFQPITAGSFQIGGGPFSLGSISLAAPKGGQAVTFSNVSFTIGFSAPAFNRTDPPSAALSIPTQYLGEFSLAGHLDGTIDGAGHGHLTLTIDAISPELPLLRIQDRVYRNGLPFSVNDVQFPKTLQLSDSGPTALMVRVVPEPASALLFLAAAGWAWRRRRAR